MPYREPDPQDPNMLVGVSVPADRETVREMAYAVAQEFARLGFDERRLMGLFSEPFYAGPHRAYRILGEREVRAIVRESVACWGRMLTVVREPETAPHPTGEQLVQIGEAADPGLGQPSTSEEGE